MTITATFRANASQTPSLEFFSEFTDVEPTFEQYTRWCDDHGLIPPDRTAWDAVFSPPSVNPDPAPVDQISAAISRRRRENILNRSSSRTSRR